MFAAGGGRERLWKGAVLREGYKRHEAYNKGKWRKWKRQDRGRGGRGPQRQQRQQHGSCFRSMLCFVLFLPSVMCPRWKQRLGKSSVQV